MTETQTVRAKLRYPKHKLCPEDLLVFIEMNGFLDDWAERGLVDDDLMALQVLVMSDPCSGKFVPEAGGLRIMEFSACVDDDCRHVTVLSYVWYVHLAEFSVVLLIAAEATNELPTTEDRAVIRELIERDREALAKRHIVRKA